MIGWFSFEPSALRDFISFYAMFHRRILGIYIYKRTHSGDYPNGNTPSLFKSLASKFCQTRDKWDRKAIQHA